MDFNCDIENITLYDENNMFALVLWTIWLTVINHALNHLIKKFSSWINHSINTTVCTSTPQINFFL